MITQELLNEVYKEADKLRLAATREELDRLDFDTFSPERPNQCIYGQIAYGCRSLRAGELLAECAVGIWVKRKYSGRGIDAISKLGRLATAIFRRRTPNFRTYMSPIEVYILQDNADNRTLLTFLKKGSRGRKPLDLQHTLEAK